MKTTKIMPISKALAEVWELKDDVYKDINKLSFEEKQKYFERGMSEAARMLKGKVITNPDGSFSIIKLINN